MVEVFAGHEESVTPLEAVEVETLTVIIIDELKKSE